jgi:hypothetical protein
MKIEKPNKRMTLRERMTHAEKCCRDLIDHVNGAMLSATSEFRDLTRPVRRRSHYPTRTALQNALAKLQQAGEDAMMLCDYMLEEFKYIGESTKREIASR